MRLELLINNISAEALDLQTLIFTGLDKKVERIYMPCGMLGFAASIYEGGPYGSIVGYPHGVDSTQLKLHAMIETSKRSVRHVHFVLNQFHIRNLEYKKIASELTIAKKMANDNGIALRAVLEHRLESLSRNVNIAKVVEAAGLDAIVTATGSIIENSPDAVLCCYKIKEFTELEVITYSHKWTDILLKSLAKAGGSIALTNNIL